MSARGGRSASPSPRGRARSPACASASRRCRGWRWRPAAVVAGLRARRAGRGRRQPAPAPGRRPGWTRSAARSSRRSTTRSGTRLLVGPILARPDRRRCDIGRRRWRGTPPVFIGDGAIRLRGRHPRAVRRSGASHPAAPPPLAGASARRRAAAAARPEPCSPHARRPDVRAPAGRGAGPRGDAAMTCQRAGRTATPGVRTESHHRSSDRPRRCRWRSRPTPSPTRGRARCSSASCGSPTSRGSMSSRRPDDARGGFCAFWLVFDELHINNLAVDARPSAAGPRRRALMTHVLAEARRPGRQRRRSRSGGRTCAALRLYERLGFPSRPSGAVLLTSRTRMR